MGLAGTNWAGNVEYQAVRLERPSTVDELCALVAASDQVRALGSGHSFSTVADSTATLVRLDGLPSDIYVDASASSVTVPAGVRYAQVGEPLHRAGFALANLASLPHISVAGAVATGTHGSGMRLHSLSDAVTAIQFVDASGSLVQVRRGDPDFPGSVVALGCLGIVTALVLAIEPTFDVSQQVRLDVPLDEICEDWDGIFGAAYSVSVFTNYARGWGNVFLKHRTDQPRSDWAGGFAADVAVHPIPGVDTSACTPQLDVPGPWHERLPHFRPDVVPSVGDELQSEFFVARELAPSAVAGLREIGDRIASVLHIAELRTVAADDLWLSPVYGRDSAAFHFTWIRDVEAVLPVLAQVEAVLMPLGARPHWGKLTTVDAQTIIRRYPCAGDFALLRARLDPTGKFANAYTSALFA